MLLQADESQLVLVDYQSRLIPAIHEGESVLAQARKLAKTAQLLQVPIWGTEQNPSGLGENDPALKALCQRTLAKMHFSAAEEGLGEWLRPPAKAPAGNARSLPKHLQKAVPNNGKAAERQAIVIAGVEAHICLLQTALDLMDDEFEVWVVTDACGSRSVRNQDAAFDRLAGAGAELVTTEMVIFEWLQTAEHPQFKEIQSLVKSAS